MTAIWKGSSVALFAAVLLLSVMYSIQYNELRVVESELDRISLEYSQLTELVNLSIPPSNYPFPYSIAIKTGCRLQFIRGGQDWHIWQGPTVAVFYNWLDNSTLELDLTVRYPKHGVYAPLTLQTGNAFLNDFLNDSATVCEEMDGYSVCHAPVYWEENATETGMYMVRLRDKGWYTISLSGKIVRQRPGGGISHSLIGVQWVNGTCNVIEGVDIYMNFRLSYEDRTVPFALNEDFIRH
jgi:hypothetical protein